MPQLDRFAWFSIIFWLISFLIPFYLLMIKFILPSVSSSLKLRNKVFAKWALTSLDNAQTREWQNTLVKHSAAVKQTIENSLIAPLEEQLFAQEAKFRELQKSLLSSKHTSVQKVTNFLKIIKNKYKK